MDNQARNIIFITCLFSTISFFLIDFYLPSFPNMASYFHADSSETKFLVSAFLLGIGMSQPIYGVLSDRFGRKNILILGIALSILANTLAIFAPDLHTIFLLRFISGLGAGACPAIARAVLSDSFSGKALLKSNAYLSMSITMSPAIAPLIGGFIEQFWGWQWSFFSISLWSMIALFLLLTNFSETHPRDKRTQISATVLKQNIQTLLSSRDFLSSATISCFAIASSLSYFIISPFIFQTHLQLSPMINGAIYITNALASLAGAYYVKQKSQNTSPESLLMRGIWLSLLGALLMLGVALIGRITLPGFIIPMLFISFAFGLIMPTTGTIAIRNFKNMGGISAALLGSIRMGGSALITCTVAFSNIQSQYALAILILALFSISRVLVTKSTRTVMQI